MFIKDHLFHKGDIILILPWNQFSLVQSLSHVRLFVTP